MKLKKERMYPYCGLYGFIVDFHHLKCEASYCGLYSFIVDFHPLKVELTKERMHAIKCEAFKSCFFA